jgi:hypothetical protein
LFQALVLRSGGRPLVTNFRELVFSETGLPAYAVLSENV